MARLSIFILFLFTAIGLGAASAAEPTFPALTGRVVDEAHILDANARGAVESKLADLETKTGRQLVVVTLTSLQGYEIEDYGYRLGRSWGIGEKDKNTGALLIVAPNEHRVRIEVGYGLEGTLTDAVSRLIIENAILPRFRVNDFSGGIQRGVDDLVLALTDNADFKRRAADQEATPSGAAGGGQLLVILLLLGVWFFFAMRSRRGGRRGRGMPWIVPIGGGWAPAGGGWGGGGSGGGFSGGGGSFGGGGASGRW